MADSGKKLDIGNLTAFLERVQSYTPDLIYFQGDVKSVHHYTDLEGLRGITGAHDLWLTHSRYSNDDEELTHGYGIVRTVIRERLAKPLVDEQKRYLLALQEELDGPTPESVYICCFCQSGDLLSQWRGYGANGAGVSLSFDPAEFSYITGPDSPSYGLLRMWSVFYSNATQRNIVGEALDFGAQTGASLEQRVARAADAIRFFIPTFKNELFAEEKEVRLIFTPAADAQVPHPDFRVARGMLVPYYRLHTLSGSPTVPRLLPLQAVRVGPSARKDLNAEAVRLLLAKAGYGNIVVDVSSTPYRG
jgi:hypothetical protein